MDAKPEPRKRTWRVAASLVVIGTLVLAIGSVLWWWVSATSIARVNDSIDHARSFFTLWRLALMGAVIVFWPRLILWLAQRFTWHDTKKQAWLSFRWRMAAWLLAIELLLAQNIAGRLLSGFA